MATSIATNTKYEILTPDGWSKFDGVTKTSKTGTVSVIVHTQDTVVWYYGHRVLTPLGFIEVERLIPGDLVESTKGTVVVTDVQFSADTVDLFDAKDVELRNQYYTNGIVSHNCVEFQGSSGTLIAGWKLKQLVSQKPEVYKDNLAMYKPSIAKHAYVISADASEGKGFDYSVLQVIDVTKMPYEQVCVFRSNKTVATDFAEIIFRVAKMYNNAAVLIEFESLGPVVADHLHSELEYDNVLFTENAGTAKGKKITSGFGNTVDKGIKMTKLTKKTGCSLLKLLIEQNQLVINDVYTIEELSTFSRKNDTFKAEEGKHDDTVMALVVFAWLSNQDYFREYTDTYMMGNIRERSDAQIEDDMVPFGFIIDGRGEDSLSTEERNMVVLPFSGQYETDF
jgi:hypothetical protein